MEIEDTWDKHRMMYGSIDSLYCTPDANFTLHLNWNLNKNLKKNHNEIPLHTQKIAIIKKIASVACSVYTLEPSLTAGGNMKMVEPL